MMGHGEEPTSLTPEDILGSGRVREAFRELQPEGLVEHLGLTGIGQPGAVRGQEAARWVASGPLPSQLRAALLRAAERL